MSYVRSFFAGLLVGLAAYTIWVIAVLFTVAGPKKAIGVRVVYGIATSSRAIAVGLVSLILAMLLFVTRK